MLALTLNYTVITGYRNFKEYFCPEIYKKALGFDPEAWHYIVIEVPGAMMTIGCCVFLSRIKSHRTALLAIHGVMLLGAASLVLATVLYPAEDSKKSVSGLVYLIVIGIGTNLVYAPAGQSEEGTPFLPRICSRTLMDCVANPSVASRCGSPATFCLC